MTGKEQDKDTQVPIDSKESASSPEGLSRNVRLALSVAGIMGFFVVYGLLQERIMTTPYDEDPATETKEFFRDSTFLVLSNRLFAAFFAIIMVLRRGESIKNVAPLHKYAGVSLSNFCATWCQYEALKFVNFPTQTLGKCGKMMPVMLVGTFLSGKKYNFKDYAIAVSITAGCVIFMLTGDISSSASVGNTPYGLFLMAAYMFFDSFTSTFQEKMFKGYTMSTYDQMIYVNGFSAILSIIVLLANNGLSSAIAFSTRHPQLLFDSTLLSICATLGQMVIYYMIKEFGALIFSTVMVTRQVVSIILSCIIYLHPLTLPQWFSAALVFGTLYYKANEDRLKHGHHGAHGGKH